MYIIVSTINYYRYSANTQNTRWVCNTCTYVFTVVSTYTPVCAHGEYLSVKSAFRTVNYHLLTHRKPYFRIRSSEFFFSNWCNRPAAINLTVGILNKSGSVTLTAFSACLLDGFGNQCHAPLIIYHFDQIWFFKLLFKRAGYTYVAI